MSNFLYKQYLNSIRNQAKLISLVKNPQLTKVAQSHANYLVHYNQTDHIQMKRKDTNYYTGQKLQNRMQYYGLTGFNSYGEVISYQNEDHIEGINQ
ncbi:MULTISPECIES: CAP domain-containing protein [Bacillus]|uniref:CAP domain-containing protein n=1 Tax=Bacillus TaxID=1386 RepID=UPI00037C110C|nr:MULTISPECIES: CAP domain-containing protein [Bacillus]